MVIHLAERRFPRPSQTLLRAGHDSIRGPVAMLIDTYERAPGVLTAVPAMRRILYHVPEGPRVARHIRQLGTSAARGAAVTPHKSSRASGSTCSRTGWNVP